MGGRERSRSPRTGTGDRKFGKIRWYNGRRQLGIIDGDDGRQVFLPVGGAYNQNLVPPNPGGLMHGTRVSYKPLSLADPDAPRGALQEACSDVRPSEIQLLKGMDVGVETRMGGRASNEDRIVANDLYDLGFLAGVFDGHGGTRCVDYVSQRFPVVLHNCYTSMAAQQPLASLNAAQEAELISRAMRRAFTATDQEYMQLAREANARDGSTGLAVLIAHGFEADQSTKPSVAGQPGGVAKLFVANCGDCRAILLRNRKALRLSEDHKPERPDEMSRIQEAGGIVIKQPCGTHRVGRSKGDNRMFLSTSRSFGDLELKQPRPLVIAEPELLVHTLEPEDWAAVIACDGVWNTMSDQDVAEAVWEVMAQGQGPIEAAQEVASRAQQTGSTDNVTVMVLRFGWSNPPPKQK